MSESTDTNSRPSLSITHQNRTHANGASLNPNFVDGAALMDEDEFLLAPQTQNYHGKACQVAMHNYNF